MPRRSPKPQAIAEKAFAVRVHVSIPEGGFRQHSDLDAFLRLKLGGDYYLGSERGFSNSTASLVIYADDLRVIADAVQRFGIEVNAQRQDRRLHARKALESEI